MYYSYVEIEYVATSFSPARTDLALKLMYTLYHLTHTMVLTYLVHSTHILSTTLTAHNTLLT